MKNNRPIENFFLEHDIFKYALILSLSIHLVIIARFSLSKIRAMKKPLQNIEVTYYNFKLQTSKINPPVKQEDRAKERQEKKVEVLLEEKVDNPPIKDLSKLDDKLEVSNKQPAIITQVEVKRKISVNPIKSEEIKNPAYRSYYQIIRGKIEKRVHANYSKMDFGKVYVTFVVSSDGSLKQTKIIEDMTAANNYLQDICLKSVGEASPFPAFPSDLGNYPERTFNVEISFEEER